MYRYLIFLFLFGLIGQLKGQQTFQGFGSIGLNASQIDGDKLAGFDKLGLHVGIGINVDVKPLWSVGLEFQYNQKGASSSKFFNADKDIKIDLNYVDVPLIVNFKDWLIEDKGYYKVNMHTGVIFSRLINKSTNFDLFRPGVDALSDTNYGYVLGVGYNFTRRLGITLRYNRFLKSIYPDIIRNVGNFKVYHWTMRTNYFF